MGVFTSVRRPWYTLGEMTSVLPIFLAVVGSFVNPIADVESADPCVVCDASLGYYYFLRSSGKSVDLYRARRLADVRQGEKRIAWAANGESEIRGDVWAPELHLHSSRKWYVYASGRLANGKVALFALESRTRDPFDGFVFKGVLDAETWGIDPTFYEAGDGQMYLAYSTGKKGVGQVLAVRRLANPWTFAGPGAVLAQAQEPWELRPPYVPGKWGSILEGPYFLARGERLFLVYSANGCWSDDYALGVLELVGDDILSASSWKRHADPILVKGNGVFGPGHATFFKSPDGTETWCAFHGMRHANEKLEALPRVLHVQRVGFTASGVPMIGFCLGRTARLTPPSGEERFLKHEGKESK